MKTYKDFCRSLLRKLTSKAFFRTPLRGIARVGLLPKSVWQRLPVEQTFGVSMPDGHGFYYSSVANDSIGRRLFWRGLKYWESETIQVFFKLAQKSNLVLDIGANTGFYTLLACAANRNSKVISFEPVPYIYKLFINNIKINDWEARCQARQEAVSNVVGFTQFHIPFGDVPSSASLHTRGFRNYKGYVIDVPVTTIDAICSEREHVDLVKIDVEGYEDKVLEGMQRVLSVSTPTFIIECLEDGPFHNVQTILENFGYRFFHLRKEGPLPVDKIVPDVKGEYRNFLCTLAGDQERLK